MIENKETRKRLIKDVNELMMKIEEIVENEYCQEDKELFWGHRQGKISPESVILMDKLLIEAKVRTKKSHLKLPNLHFESLSSIFK